MHLVLSICYYTTEINVFPVNLKSPAAAAAPTPKYSYLLFSDATYLVLKDYPFSANGSPDTAQLCGMSEV